MVPDVISDDLSICQQRKKDVDDVVGECAAIRGVGRRQSGIEMEYVGQQRLCNPRCFLRRITACVLQRVREDGDEGRVVRRFRREVVGSVLTGKKDGL